MAKLRKMLGEIDSQECKDLMALIETQSKQTLAGWAINYACENYLEIYEHECPEDGRLKSILDICFEYLEGSRKLNETKPFLKEARQIASGAEGHPVAQAAARAIATACSVVQTPTSALGFLFYGAAAAAYSESGLDQTADVYDRLATAELQKALASLQKAAVPDEQKPAKIKWGC